MKEFDKFLLDQKKWELFSFKGVLTSNLKKIPTIEFNIDDRKFYGTGGCNRFFGEIKLLTSKKVALGRVASTRKACFEDNNIEKEYFEALERIDSYNIDNTILYFYDPMDNKLMSFVLVKRKSN